MEQRGITTELPDNPKDVKEYTEDFQDQLSKRVIKQIKQVKNAAPTTRTVQSNSGPSMS